MNYYEIAGAIKGEVGRIHAFAERLDPQEGAIAHAIGDRIWDEIKQLENMMLRERLKDAA